MSVNTAKLQSVFDSLKTPLEFKKEIGSGATSYVFKAKAKDPAINRNYAVKVLNPSLVKEDKHSSYSTSRNYLLFQEEVVLHNAIAKDNPLVVQVFDYSFGVENFWFAVMEYGKYTIRSVIDSSSTYNLSDKLYFSINIAEAVKSVHDKGVVHKDVKPENFIVTGNKRVKITDFGIAKTIDLRTAQNIFSCLDGTVGYIDSYDDFKITGTPEYVSPEAIIPSTVDFRSDIFSTGVVLYELFTGSLPRVPTFEPDPNDVFFQMELLDVIARTPVKKFMPEDRKLQPLADIVNKSLENDPNARYQTMSSFISELKDFSKSI